MHHLHPIARGIGLGLLLAGTTTHADDTTPALKTVTVTAQHREETLLEVPVAVSAVQGTSITADGVRAMGDITTFIPNASAKNPDGDGRPRWYIRGLGTGDTGAATVYPVGIYADDVYLNAPVAGGGPLSAPAISGSRKRTATAPACAVAIKRPAVVHNSPSPMARFVERGSIMARSPRQSPALQPRLRVPMPEAHSPARQERFSDSRRPAAGS